MPVEGQQHEFAARREGLVLHQQAFNKRGVHPGHVFHTGGVQIKRLLQAFNRMPQAVHARIDPGAGTLIAATEQVYVAIPQPRGIDALPDACHQRMTRELRRQFYRGTVIPKSLIRPESPTGEAKGSDTGRGEKAAAS